MSYIMGHSVEDFIGATIVSVEGRDYEGDIIDFGPITIQLLNGSKVLLDANIDDAYESPGLCVSSISR